MESARATIASPRAALEILGTAEERHVPEGGFYFAGPIPSAADEAILSVVEWYRAASKDDREALSRGLIGKAGNLLVAFSERMAVEAARKRSVDPIRAGLLAIAMLPDEPTEALDFRDWLPILALHYSSARKAGADPLSLFDEAATLADPAIGATIFNYAREGEHSLKAMGYVEENSSSGFTYRRTW